MGYYSDVKFALPISNWKALKAQAAEAVKQSSDPDGRNLLEHPESEREFDWKGQRWVLVTWYYVKWYFNEPDVAVIEAYLNESDEYEYARVGEEVDDVERRSGDDSYEILHTITIIEVQVDICRHPSIMNPTGTSIPVRARCLLSLLEVSQNV